MLTLKDGCIRIFSVILILTLIWMAFKKEKLVNTAMKDSKTTSANRTVDGPSSEKGEDLPDDPYMSYLFHPRLTFSGTFHSDVSTVNNNPSNYDTDNFVLKHSQSWNSRGTGEWNVNAAVTQVCYNNATCVAIKDVKEPLVGALFQEGGNKTLAKMVDLDTEAQLFSEIWGWRIRVGDFFSADFTPVPFQYMWSKVIDSGTLASSGAAYQSVLSNIKWIDDKESFPLIEEWKRIMNHDNIDSDKLSIRFNVDMYQLDPKKSDFTYGRATGSIGLLGIKSPPFFSYGRMLLPQSKKVQNTPFMVDKKKHKVYVDFGNSFQITRNGSFDTGMLNNLYVGSALNIITSHALSCRNEILWLGKVRQTEETWYKNSAGIQSFPEMKALTKPQVEIVKNNPLFVAEISGIWPAIGCKNIVLAEAIDGIDIHPFDGWTLREDPKKTAQVRLFATRFGDPLSGVKVKFGPNKCTNIFADGPQVGVPEIPAPDDVITNLDGIAEFAITTKDPKSPRGYIDGQVYPYTYYLEGQSKDFSLMCEDVFELLNHLIVLLVWDQYGPFAEPTWLDHVYPVFKQYANLYPVMTENIVNLGNYYEVIKYKKAIQISMGLPISHPNYMPVTRDISSSKREAILDWLKKDDPPIGDPKVLYTVEHLRKDLQTALQLELATIPPYLTALASIKYNYNADVQSIIRSIVVQEMMHMSLAANILNAVGGSPVIYSNSFAPYYPSRLPGGIQPDLVVPIEKVSISLIRNVFMKIEEPLVTQNRKSSFDVAFQFINREKCSDASKYANQESCRSKLVTAPNVLEGDPGIDETYDRCLSPEYEKASLANFMQRHYGSSRQSLKDEKNRKRFPTSHYEYEKHHNTIGAFYNHILNTLGYLTDCGRNNSIFTGDPKMQVDSKHASVHGHSLRITDFVSAVKAIELIVEQGEGSSPCNPVAWNNGTVKDLSHYFLFYSIVEKREIQVFKTGSRPEKSESIQDTGVDFSKGCNGTYRFTGPKIPFDSEGVWPIVSNPKMSKYKEGTRAYRKAAHFNKVYTKLLKSLHYVFNGHPDSLTDALGLMYSVDLHLKKLVRTPIDPDGDPDVGPNAGPAFDFVP